MYSVVCGVNLLMKFAFLVLCRGGPQPGTRRKPPPPPPPQRAPLLVIVRFLVRARRGRSCGRCLLIHRGASSSHRRSTSFLNMTIISKTPAVLLAFFLSVFSLDTLKHERGLLPDYANPRRCGAPGNAISPRLHALDYENAVTI